MRIGLVIILSCVVFAFTSCNITNDIMSRKTNTDNYKTSVNNETSIKNLVSIKNNGNKKLYHITDKLILNTQFKTKEYPTVSEYLSPQRIYFSQNIYYQCKKNNYTTIKVIDTVNDKTYDLRQVLSLENYNIHRFSYNNKKMLAYINKKDSDSISKPIIIDLEQNKFKKVKFPNIKDILRYKTNIYNDNKVLIFYYSNNNYGKTKMMIADMYGNIVRKFSCVLEPSISYVRISPNSRYMLYSVGQTPIDLYLYDFKTERKYTVINSAESRNGLIFMTWNDNNNFYYKQFSMDKAKEQKLVKKNVFHIIE